MPSKQELLEENDSLRDALKEIEAKITEVLGDDDEDEDEDE